MNDPWDVKSVRQAGQYVSCMKINGVPLLPPVLSKECRKEMQYYKLLAKEVDKRISLLQPFVTESDSESEDRTDAPELSECEYELPHEQVKPAYYAKNPKRSVESSPGHASSPPRHASSPPRHISSPPRRVSSPPRHVSSPPRHATSSPKTARATDVCNNNITSNVIMESIESSSRSSSPKLIIDLNLSINNESGNNVVDIIRRTPPQSPTQVDLPERDYNCTTRITRKIITEKEVITETQRNKKNQNCANAKVVNLNLHNNLTDPFADHKSQDGPASLSSKSFTGSLNDLHRDSLKDLQNALPLIRQRSYTLLKPSPQLLAHLEVQSLNTGVEMSSISMSESLSSLSPTKKRRSWDLETAKVKWSNMALELKQSKANNLNKYIASKSVVKQQPKPSAQTTPLSRQKSVAPEKTKRIIKPMVKSNPTHNSDPLPKPEPISKTRKSTSPVRNTNNRTIVKDPVTPRTNIKLELQPQTHAPPPIISESDDPAARVRELYEKIQNQQLLQMASLVEKQKREQILLQQFFEEQNSVLFKQLKTICPTSPIEVKEAWGDKHLEQSQESDRGPVSLSQLINYKSPDQSSLESPVSNTLTNTNNYINQCDNVLKKSRDITGSIKKQPIKARSQNGTKIVAPRTQPEGSRTSTQSPNPRNTPSPPQRNTPTSRRLNYETSASSDRDYEPMLTDRTNDTMADLNVTFPSDNDDGNCYAEDNDSVVTSHIYGKETKTIHATSTVQCSLAENSNRIMERTIHNSINSTKSLTSRAKFSIQQATPQERAAATKIVALAKGYLVRRLMRTDRVQATVQTIKDALLCALQLHQDREGIRGADVDLHRRLIQQITAACYSLHDTFVASTAAERCAMIAADRGRRRSLAARQLSNPNSFRQTDIMSQSHTGAFPARTKRPTTASLMTQSNYETFSEDKGAGRSVSRHMGSPYRRPWR